MELTKEQKIAISVLAVSNLKEKFYWTGGTLLSYHYLKHRKSEDLDFFSEKEFSLEEVNRLIQHIQEKGGFKKITYHKIFDRFEFLLKNEEALRIEFVFYNHEKKTIRQREKLLGIYVDSLEDIAANKTMAYFDRNEPKDLFDIYFLIQKGGFTAKKLLDLARQKFGVEFPQSLFWSQAFKLIPLLATIKPLMVETTKTQREDLLKKIERYFKDESERFLSGSLEL